MRVPVLDAFLTDPAPLNLHEGALKTINGRHRTGLRIVLFGNGKGGSGKSTLCMNVAIGYKQRRKRDIAARASQLQSGHAFGNLHDEYGHRSLSRKEAIAIATRALPAEIDWSVFENLDFDKLAAGRRTPGRRGEN